MTTTLEAAGRPFQEAVDFFRQKVPVHTQHWTDVWRTAHSRGFMVAGAASDALLSDFREAIAKGLEAGTTLAEFRADFDRIVSRNGWVHNGSAAWRSRVIYETNLSTAFSAGQYAQMTEPATLEAFPFWQYVHSGSSHPRLQHLAWDGLTLRADDPFWSTHYPPNGWHCGCRARPVSERGLGRMGKTGPDTAPPLETRPWRNPRTGEVHQVPVGIDPGFDYNPGLAWKRGGGAMPVRAVPLRADAPEIVHAPPGREAVDPDVLHAFLAEPQGAIQIGRVPKSVSRVLEGESQDVLFSAATLRKQRSQHGDLPDALYFEALQQLLAAPEVVLDNRTGHVRLLGRHEDQALTAVVKRTANGKETWLQSFHTMRPRSAAAFVRKHPALMGDAADLLRWLAVRTR